MSKKGISMIVLVITIIVIIILAGTVILSLNNTKIIENANLAELLSNIDSYKSSLYLKTMDSFTDDLDSNINIEVGKYENNRYVIRDYIPEMTDEDVKIFGIKDNELVIAENQNVVSYDKISSVIKQYGKIQDVENPEIKEPKAGDEAPMPKGWVNDDIIPIYVNDVGNKLDIIPVPKGFTVSSLPTENNINTGVVIYKNKDTNLKFEYVDEKNYLDALQTRDQYVFVRVKDINEYERVNWIKGDVPVGNLKFGNLNEKDLPSYLETDKQGETEQREIDSINKYKGFYIGRYESGTETTRNKKGDALTNVVIRKNKNVYNYIEYEKYKGNDNVGAKSLAKSLVNINGNVKSGLVTGSQWDMAIKFIQTNFPNYATNSEGKGNYDSKSLILTGSNDNYKVNNIYDMAGNVWEWTNENNLDLTSRVHRGGPYNKSARYYAAGNRYRYKANACYEYVGFRVSLYIK